MNGLSKAFTLYANDFLHVISPAIGKKQYNKFIILGRSRVGSNMLRSILNNHKKIIAFGELFRTEGEVGWGIPYYWHNRINLFGEDDHLKQQPIDFLERRIYKSYPSYIKAVGFKLFYYHAQQKNWKQVWHYLKDEKVKVIHLKRRNLLKVHISRELAERTGNWLNKKYDITLSLDPHKCLRDFERTERWWEEFDSFFKTNELLEVWFEDLIKDRDLWTTKILDFLDIKSHGQKLNPATKRQNKKSESELIKNYDEVRKKFIGTKWEHLFD